MAPANTEDHFAFIAFDCPIYACAVLVTHVSAKICRIDRRLFAGCVPVPYPSVLSVHDPPRLWVSDLIASTVW
jgi:hypothetical protein